MSRVSVKLPPSAPCGVCTVRPTVVGHRPFFVFCSINYTVLFLFFLTTMKTRRASLNNLSSYQLRTAVGRSLLAEIGYWLSSGSLCTDPAGALASTAPAVGVYLTPRKSAVPNIWMTHVSSPLILSPFHLSVHQMPRPPAMYKYTVDEYLHPSHLSACFVLRPICTQGRAPRSSSPRARVDHVTPHALMPPRCAPCACSKSGRQ